MLNKNIYILYMSKQILKIFDSIKDINLQLIPFDNNVDNLNSIEPNIKYFGYYLIVNFINTEQNVLEDGIFNVNEKYFFELLQGKELQKYQVKNKISIYFLNIKAETNLMDKDRKDCTNAFTILWITINIMNNLQLIENISKEKSLKGITKLVKKISCNNSKKGLCLLKAIFNTTEDNERKLKEFMRDLVEYKILEKLFVFDDLKKIYENPDKNPKEIKLNFFEERIYDLIYGKENFKNLQELANRKFDDNTNIIGYILFYLRDEILEYVKSYTGDFFYKNNINPPDNILCYTKELWKEKKTQIFEKNIDNKNDSEEMIKSKQLLNFLESIQIKIMLEPDFNILGLRIIKYDTIKKTIFNLTEKLDKEKQQPPIKGGKTKSKKNKNHKGKTKKKFIKK